jgi:hypothetical protein
VAYLRCTVIEFFEGMRKTYYERLSYLITYSYITQNNKHPLLAHQVNYYTLSCVIK